MLARMLCLARGGPRWQVAVDCAGSLVWCARCGRQHHSRAIAPDLDHRIHANLGYEVMLRESPGADVITDKGEK